MCVKHCLAENACYQVQPKQYSALLAFLVSCIPYLKLLYCYLALYRLFVGGFENIFAHVAAITIVGVDDIAIFKNEAHAVLFPSAIFHARIVCVGWLAPRYLCVILIYLFLAHSSNAL